MFIYSLFNRLVWFLWHINLCRLFNAKSIPLEEEYWYYLTYSWEDKGVHTFPTGICLNVNVKGRLEYELAYYDSAVQRFNHEDTPYLTDCAIYVYQQFNKIGYSIFLLPEKVKLNERRIE